MKMEAPKMDVVRFKESDVIVASTPTSYVFGFNNEVPNDAYIKHNGVTYTDSATFASAMANEGLAPVFEAYLEGGNAEGTYYNTSLMFYADSVAGKQEETSVFIPDGTYQWNGEHFKYKQ